MCGIAGFYDDQIPSEGQPSLLEKMLHAISHRGPDARGVFIKDSLALGHNRLSIIDLSEEGNQPMHRGEFTIVYNGEVYNYREIRDELIKDNFIFRTQSDTEVILAAYEKWGQSCVQRFVGMWAFVIHDRVRNLLFCSRDRFGIKPFHYILNEKRFYFGSEYKALFPSPLFKGKLNEQQIFRGLQLGWTACYDETYYSDIRTLPEAHNLVFDLSKGSITVSRYWDIDTSRQSDLSSRDYSEQFAAMFMDSLRLHMRSDVEVGACLSGGLDSSSIVSGISKEFPDTHLKTFTVYYEGRGEVDERPWVHEVLKKNPSVDPFYFTPSGAEIRDEFDKALWHADVPLTASSPVSQYFVMKLAASKGIKVVLDGQGSDEMLGGYMHSFYRLIGGFMRKFSFGSAFAELNTHSNLQGFDAKKRIDLLAKSTLAGFRSEKQLYEMEYFRYLPFLATSNSSVIKMEDKPGTRLNQFLYQLTFASSLPTLLQFEDRNSMAFSIESRVPFLDHRLVEFVFSLPDEAKIYRGVTKKVLRDGLTGILPEAIAQRRDKKGFVTPGEVKWLRGPLSHLLDQNFNDIPFLKQDVVKKVLGDFRAGQNRHANLVWRLAVLRRWMRK